MTAVTEFMDYVIIYTGLFAECKVLDNFQGLEVQGQGLVKWSVLQDPRGQGLSSRTTTLVPFAQFSRKAKTFMFHVNQCKSR